MKQLIKNIIILTVLIFITFQILIDSKPILEVINFSFNIWKNNVFPSLFPFFVISELFINYGLVELLGEIFKPLMNKLFKVKGVSAFAVIMSIISGFPSSAKYVRELYKQNLITDKEATKLLMFTHFSNPLFILGTISILFLNNKKVGLLILICHYLGDFIIGIIFRNYYPTYEKNTKISIKEALKKINEKQKNNKSFGENLTNALLNSINTLILILGIITMFLIVTTIIDNLINLNSFHQSILNGIIEMTQGLKYISLENISLKLKCIISTMIISFGGLSVHMQIISILSDTKIKYLPFLLARIFHSIISGILITILFDFWM